MVFRNKIFVKKRSKIFYINKWILYHDVSFLLQNIPKKLFKNLYHKNRLFRLKTFTKNIWRENQLFKKKNESKRKYRFFFIYKKKKHNTKIFQCNFFEFFRVNGRNYIYLEIFNLLVRPYTPYKMKTKMKIKIVSEMYKNYFLLKLKKKWVKKIRNI